MPRCSPLVALLLLPGCLSRMLWPGNGDLTEVSQRREATFAVVAVAVADSERAPAGTEAPPRLLLQLQRVRGSWTEVVDDRIAQDTTLAWTFDDPALAPAIADLLAAEPLGPIDRCDLHVVWTRSAEGYEFWEGRIALHGDLAAFAEGSIVPQPVPTTAAALPKLAAATALDWRVLVPWQGDGSGTVIACLPRGLDPAADLLVRVDATPPRTVCVPANIVPVLAAVRRDPDTLLPRFLLHATGRVRPVAATGAWRPLASPRELHFVTRVETVGPRLSPLERYVLKPLVQVVDAVGCLLLHTLASPHSWNLPTQRPRHRRDR